MKGFIITGFGHSGTRLAFDMFKKHPDFSAPPQSKLNSVREFGALHKMYIDFIKDTDFNSDTYKFDKSKFVNVLNSYSSLCDKSKIILVKMPYYPLNTIGAFRDFFQNGFSICYTKRNKEKILKSFERRGELRNFFHGSEFKQQLKKFSVNDRVRISETYSWHGKGDKELTDMGRELMSLIHDDAESKLATLRNNGVNIPYLQMDKISNTNYLVGFFNDIGHPIDIKTAKSMVSIIDTKRI